MKTKLNNLLKDRVFLTIWACITFFFAISCICLFLLVVSLTHDASKSADKCADIERLLSLSQQQLTAAEAKNINDSAQIIALQNIIEEKELEIENMNHIADISLFDSYFSNINFNSRLNYKDLWQFNKQYSICTNKSALDTVSELLELNQVLLQSVKRNYETETDETMKIILDNLIQNLQEEIERLLPIYNYLTKENLELQDYDETIPMPIG